MEIAKGQRRATQVTPGQQRVPEITIRSTNESAEQGSIREKEQKPEKQIKW